MGHILGVGTGWVSKGLTSNPFFFCDYLEDSKASNEWKCLTGCNGEVPVEQNIGSLGSDCSHWDENCLQTEMMTPRAERTKTSMPISRITAATLSDLGYLVNFDAADPFSKNQVKSSCVCEPDISNDGGRRRLAGGRRRPPKDKKKELPFPFRRQRRLESDASPSAQAERAAIAYGKSILRKSQLEETEANHHPPLDTTTTTATRTREYINVSGQWISVFFHDPDTPGLVAFTVVTSRDLQENGDKVNNADGSGDPVRWSPAASTNKFQGNGGN